MPIKNPMSKRTALVAPIVGEEDFTDTSTSVNNNIFASRDKFTIGQSLCLFIIYLSITKVHLLY
jgi:hypothetical protein